MYYMSLIFDSNLLLNMWVRNSDLILVMRNKTFHGGFGHEIAVLVLILFANM